MSSERPQTWRRRLTRLGVALAGIYLAICVLMVAFEESLLFHPTVMPSGVRELLLERAEIEPIEVDAGEVMLHGFFVQGEGDAPRPTLLYFGGNAEQIWRRVDDVPGPNGARFNRAYLAYRGYEGSGGSPAADDLLADALRFYDHVVGRPDVDAETIVVRGTSLGTGLATHVAHERPVAGVVLLAPYDRLENVAAGHYPWLPVRVLMRNDIDSLARAPEISVPLLLAHGEADEVIPVEHGRALAAAWRGPVEELYLPTANHNDLGGRRETTSAVDTFLGRITSR